MQLVHRWVRYLPCFLLVWLMTGWAQAQSSPVPALARPVRLPAGWAPLAQVLAEASRQTGVPISYSSTRVATSRRVYVPAGPPRPLGAVLHDVLSAQHVSFGLLSGQVVLWTGQKMTPPGVTNVNEHGAGPTSEVARTGPAAPGSGVEHRARPGASPNRLIAPRGAAVVPTSAPIASAAGPVATANTVVSKRFPNNSRGRVAERARVAERLQHRPAPASTAEPIISPEPEPNSSQALDSVAARPVQVACVAPSLPAALPLAAPAPLPVAAERRHRTVHFSLVYPLSTNGLANARTANQASLNALVGYAAGVDGAEVGGLANVVRDSVRGAQVAGLFNVTGTTVSGVQLAGLANFTGGTVRGVQGAYLLNVVRDDARGVQVAGLLNVVGGAGRARSLPDQPTRMRRWLGLPRLLATDELARLPAAPSTSAPGSLVQAAGIANITGTDVRGLQTAPLLNLARRVRGVQFGLVNVAGHVRGVQLGIINIADSVEGAPIGFINIVRHGYWRGEVWASETLPLNAVLKMGVRRYYSILGISAQPFGNRLKWAVCSGIGTAGLPHGRFTFSLDVLQWGLAGSKSDDPNDVPGLVQVRPALAWQIERESRMQLVVSPTLNLALATRTAVQSDWDFGANQLLIVNSIGAQTITRLWPGLQVGLRFQLGSGK
ncbi:MAG TPA: hypothetical protein VF690_00210 [Hymenobacter sp.]